MSMTDVWVLINQGGGAAFMFVAIVGALRGWWVPGYLYRRLQEDYDRLMELALTGSSMAKELTKAVPSARNRNQRGP